MEAESTAVAISSARECAAACESAASANVRETECSCVRGCGYVRDGVQLPERVQLCVRESSYVRGSCERVQLREIVQRVKL